MAGDAYRVGLRNPADPPTFVIEQLQEWLPDVDVGPPRDGILPFHLLVENRAAPPLEQRVKAVIHGVCGEEWHDHFYLLDDSPPRD